MRGLSIVRFGLGMAPLLVLAMLLMGCAADGRSDAARAGAPQGWRPDTTRAGRGGPGGVAGVWTVRDGVLRLDHIPHDDRQTFNLCWRDEPTLADVAIRVQLQAQSGAIDQGGGVMWRGTDRDHYYICRANPLEDNFRLYKVVGGVRTQLASTDIAMPDAAPGSPGAWHTIEVTHRGDRIICVLDGATRLEVTDPTLPAAGRTGVWTKADARTWFRQFEARAVRVSGSDGRE